MKKLLIILSLISILFELKLSAQLSMRCITASNDKGVFFKKYGQKGVKDVTDLTHINLEKGEILIVSEQPTKVTKSQKDKTIHISTGG